jgi:hypothetical protein
VKTGEKPFEYYKVKVDLASIIGRPYGSIFKVKDNNTGELDQVTDMSEMVEDFILLADNTTTL